MLHDLLGGRMNTQLKHDVSPRCKTQLEGKAGRLVREVDSRQLFDAL
jgi:hypothetical protein